MRDGFRACYSGLGGAGGIKSAAKNFSLDALAPLGRSPQWLEGQRTLGTRFRARPRLWQGLLSVYDYIEHYGGGGLNRPLFAEFLSEAAEVCKDERLKSLAAQYEKLGRAWSQLADAALPEAVPAFREAKELQARKAELTNSGGSVEEIQAIWARLGELRRQVCESFPLTEDECTELRAGLQKRVRALYEGRSRCSGRSGRNHRLSERKASSFSRDVLRARTSVKTRLPARRSV